MPVAAICGATYALAAAGLLDHRRHTSNDPGYLASSGYAGAEHYVEEPAVIDGDLVTATGIAPVRVRARRLRAARSPRAGRARALVKLYADRDPAGFYELTSA